MSPEATDEISYTEIQPGEECAPLISEFWRFETGALDGDARDHFIPPDGLPSLWALYRADAPIPIVGVTGPGSAAHKATIEPGMRIIGLRLRPAVFRPVFGVSATAIAGRAGPLEFFGVTPPTGLADAATRAPAHGDWSAMKRIFGDIATRGQSIDHCVQRVAMALMDSHGDAAIEYLAAQNQLSARQMRRRFRDEMGMSPKAFAQIRRVRKLCIDALQSELGWSDLSLEAGFADQAHMARNIQSVFGLRPSEVRKRIRQIAHGDVFS